MLNLLKNLALSGCGILVSMTTSILVMINGWGLEPKSWTWIIGVYLVGSLFSSFLVALTMAKDPNKTL